MDFFSFIPITAALVNLFLGIFVLTQGPKIKLNIVYFFWAIALALWNGGTALAFYASTYSQGLFAARLLQYGVIGLPFLLYHLSTIICKKNGGRSIYLLYVTVGVFLLSNLLGMFVKDVRYVKELGAYYSVGNYPFWAFALACTFVSGAAVVVLHRSYAESSPLLRRRIRLVLIASYLIVGFGWNDILPIVGIYSYPLTGIQILPLGSAAAIFYGLIVGYSVLQNQLLDVRLSIGRSTANLLRALQLMLVGFTLLIATSVLAPKDTFSKLTFTLFSLILAATGMVAAVIFPRLFGTGADRIEKLILGDGFQYQDRIAAFINTLPWYTNFQELFTDLGTIFSKILGVNSYKIVLLDQTATSFSVLKDESILTDTVFFDGGKNSATLGKFKKADLEYLYLSELDPDEGEMCFHELVEKFQVQSPEICLPFRANDDPFGLVILSSKANLDPYTKSDLDLLTRLVRSLSLVINQIRLQDELRAEHELDLLGKISRGLAHDLNNLLTPVATLLQVTIASPSNDPEIDELVAISDRNVRTMKNYIRDSLFFSKTRKLQMSIVTVNDLVSAAVNLMTPQSKERGTFLEFDSPPAMEMVLDAVLFQRLVSNLISNAIDASKAGSKVRVEIKSIQRRDDESPWVQLKVIDHGEGISPENLEKMKAAFFTTKDSGDGKRGFGLGLAICRKIVHLHGGTLNITSKIGEGTTVQVDLPGGSLPALIAAPHLAEPVAA